MRLSGINEDLRQVDKWLKANKLSLNFIKIHSKLISTKPQHKTLEGNSKPRKLKTRSNELEVVQKPKYLGVQSDSSLDWKNHIKTVSSKLSKSIGFSTRRNS